MEFKRRKLEAEKAERRPRPVKRAKVDETDIFQDEEAQFESEEDAFSGVSENDEGEDEEDEDEGSDSGAEEDDEDNGDLEDEDAEVEAPRSPTDGLSFGEMLKRREKEATKRKAGGSGAEAAGDKAANEDQTAAGPEKGKVKQRAAPRTSKHAPAEVTSRFAVKRGRNWLSGDATIAGVDVRPTEMRSRDPRFFLASMSGPASRKDTLRARRNYAFLDEYRDEEMQQLRETLTTAERAVKAVRKSAAKRRGRNGRGDGELPPQQQQRLEAAETAAEELKRKLASMEARKRDRQAKDREQDVLEEHKKRERELVRQGKKPFFLKRSEQRKQLLVDQFASMSEQQVDKAMDRRRKKVASRERKEMPLVRRG